MCNRNAEYTTQISDKEDFKLNVIKQAGKWIGRTFFIYN